MSVTVEFINVGRGKKSWRQPLDKLSDQALYRAVKKSGALGSTDIDFTLDENGNGKIYAGFHNVGEFRFIKGA